MVRTGLQVLGLSLVALSVLFVSAAPARAANVSCRVGEAGDPGPKHNVLWVDDTSESVTHIYRDGDEIVVSNNADTEPAVCAGGPPTVFSVDRIVYSTASGAPFINYFGDGPLAPGATDEPGADEIEIAVIEAYEPKVLNVGGGAGNDRIEIGQIGERSVGVDLDAGSVGPKDVDVSVGLIKGDEIFLRVSGKAGSDRISALGANGYPDPVSSAERVAMIGGDGDDVLSGGPSRDALSGNQGNDELFGGRGRDKLTVGPGRDLAKGGKGDDSIDNLSDVGGIPADLVPDWIFGGAGNDRITTQRGLAGDRVDCGAGRRDSLFGDRGDLARHCETTDFR